MLGLYPQLVLDDVWPEDRNNLLTIPSWPSTPPSEARLKICEELMSRYKLSTDFNVKILAYLINLGAPAVSILRLREVLCGRTHNS
jgi:hypothetical protein